MAPHLWVRMNQDRGRREDEIRPEWTMALLPDEAKAFVLTDDARHPVRLPGKSRNGRVVGQLLRIGDRQNETWVLQSAERERISVNGCPLVAGIRVLENKDEIVTRAAGRMYFSSERAPRVEPFPGREQATACPRCKATIAKGEPSVQCPQCRTWHHERTDTPCWSYAEKCALCDQLTRLDTGFRWTPETL